VAYDALDFQEELQKAASSSAIYRIREMHNGQIITIGNEHFSCPVTLFQPAQIDLEGFCVHEKTFQSIMKCDMDICKDLYLNVVLPGGSTMLESSADRMNKKLVSLAPNEMKFKITATPKRKYSV
jgi:actin beta/gamma 1